ncbi:hypothetical protein [uncultured Rothia sp.]|uniref:RHS repeat protein n=1 Tax=uncultured Rothia sp. TaxID=316088 RepID=UPI0028DC5D91|nr:hypothetical protein [uncultured Rothia sp.]
MRTFLIVFWGVDAFGAPVVTVESYDRLGRLIRQRREFGAQIPESFRTEYMDETGGYELSYAYDADGLRTEFVHPLGSSAYAYDAAGRMVKQTDITAYRLDGTAVTSESRVESSFEYNAVDALVRAQVSDLAGTWVREFGYRGAHMISVTEQPAEADPSVADSSEALRTEIIRDDLGRISGVDSPAGLVMYTYTDAQMLSSAVRGTETLRWTYDAAGALVRVEYFDSAQPQNAWVKVLVTDEGARVRAVCLYGVQDEAKADSQSSEFAPVVGDAQAWLGQCPESVEVEGVSLVPVSTSVFSYDGNDSRLLQVSSDGSGSSVTYGASGFVSSVASWGSAEGSAVCFSLLCASADGRVLAAGGASVGVSEFGVPSTDTGAGAHAGAGAGAGSVAGFDASVMHPLVWDENLFVPRVLGVGGSSLPSVGSLVPGAGSGAGLLDPYGWASLGVAAPAVPSAQGASSGGVPVLPDSLVGVSAASGLVLGSTGFEVLGARVVDSRVARFTAPDPLAAPVGAGWGADPFSLVGGNPVLLVDPWGLSPVSVEDFEKYRQERIRDQGTTILKNLLTTAGIVASAAAIVFTGGTALIVLGAIAGGTLAAANAIDENKDPNTGEVNWINVGISAGVGALFGGISGGMGRWASGPISKMFTGPANGTGKLMASTPARVWQATKVRMTVEGAKSGVSSAVDGTKDAVLSVLTGGKHKYSPEEHAFKVASGMAFGGLNSMISPVSGSLSKTKASQLASKYIPGVSEKGIRKSISVSADTVSSMGQSAFESWGTGKEVRVEDLVWKGVATATKKSKDYAKNAPTGDVGAPSTLKQMGTRPYTYGTYLNSKSRTESFQKYFDQEAQKSVTNHVNKKYHLKDAYDIYTSRPGFLVWNDKDLKAESAVAEKGKGE